ELMNGVSRWMEYDLRNDLFTHLETLDPAYFAQTRTGDIMARLTNDLGAVRMALGPAVMYLTNTIFGGLFALYFMLRIDVKLTLLPLFAFCCGLGAVIVLGAGGALTIKGAISVGSFVAFGMYLTMLTWPMIALGWVVNLFQRGEASMGRLNEIFDVEPSIVA